MELSGLDELLEAGRRNAVLAWLLIALLAGASVGVGIVVGPLWSVFALTLLILAILPAVAFRSPTIMLPWEILFAASLPVVALAVGTPDPTGGFLTYLAVAAIALVVAVEIETFTPIGLSPGFATGLVVVATLAAAGLWGVVRWGSDVYLGTGYITTNDALMTEWLFSALAGLAAGIGFSIYLPRVANSGVSLWSSTTETAASQEVPHHQRPDQSQPGWLRSRFGLSSRRQRQLTYAMELGLVGLLFVGLERGNPGIVVNTAVALGVAQIPALLERDFDLTLDPRLILWITSAAFLHALGTVGIPSTGLSFYATLGWWDHMTHALSASVVAGVGYTTVRAIDAHSDRVYLPARFIAVIILLVVLAFGVVWELLEFAIGEAAAEIGTASVLTQYGVNDTLWDLIYNTIGGVVVALWGGVYLSGLSTVIADRLANR